MSDSPPTLYELCINAAVEYYTRDNFAKKEFRALPDYVLFDFYNKMRVDKRLCLLSLELRDLEVFKRMLKVTHRRTQLLQCFQALISHGAKTTNELVLMCKKQSDIEDDMITIDFGLKMATFFREGGWFAQSHDILNFIEEICLKYKSDLRYLMKLLDCYNRRIFVESSYCMFHEAANTFKLAQDVIKELTDLNAVPNLAPIYATFANLYNVRSEYDEAYKWAKLAVSLLTIDLPTRVIVEVLRIASKACVFKRQFTQAGLLIEQAFLLADEIYKIDGHPNYCYVLLDFGYYLLNYDSIEESVKLYKQALDIRRDILGKNNLLVAIAYEDLAYAVYVNEYSSGKFYDAKDYADKAITIMEKILPSDHLALASTSRVKALILEEIAVDMRDTWSKHVQQDLLQKSEDLHKAALKLSIAAFGEHNIQTAKHYGNLGRLYQSMQKFELSEEMHLHAISIKEDILGTEDYEVGLSIGHLASLYNFHMKRYQEAELLYNRSIDISVKLFGHLYSGLEYDYRGLINVYTELDDVNKLITFISIMREWKNQRESLMSRPTLPNLIPLSSVINKFKKLC